MQVGVGQRITLAGQSLWTSLISSVGENALPH